jgi:hypothetical protein
MPRQWPSASARPWLRGSQWREVWNASNRAVANAERKALVEADRNEAPELAAWLEVAIPEGLAVFTQPEHHRERLRAAHPIEGAVHQELERRSVKAPALPRQRLATAPRHCAPPLPYSSRSTEHGRLRHNPTSTGKPRMLERATSEVPEIGLRDRHLIAMDGYQRPPQSSSA